MRLTGIDLNLLVAFDALMAERSVTRAAERLSLGQSAMSATLARLRRTFDDPLLVREGRRLVPTPLAESLIDPVRDALTLIEQTLAARSRFDPATDHRTFSVVASDYVTLVLLGPLLARLAVEAPHVRVHVRPVAADFRDQLRRDLQHQTEWITNTIRDLRAAGKTVIEPTVEGEQAWVEHHEELAGATLLPRTSSWYLGTNVPGKPRRLLPYVGGVGLYRRKCEEEATHGYPSFRRA